MMDTYHHGNLRESVLELAFSKIEIAGAEAITLAVLARELNVTSAAILRHFKSLSRLYAELSERCRLDFAEYLRQCEEGWSHGELSIAEASERFDAYFHNYLAYSRRKPRTYEFATRYFGSDYEPSDTGRGPQWIVGALKELHDAGLLLPEALVGGAVLWFSLLHGYASLRIMATDRPTSVIASMLPLLDQTMMQSLRRSMLRPEYV